jgi:hypothetical protein
MRHLSTTLRGLAAALLVAGLVACQATSAPVQATPPPAPPAGEARPPAASPIELRLDKTEYRAGERVALTIVNRGDRQYGFNPCNRTVEQETGGTWTPFEEPGRICTLEIWTIDPGQTRTAETTLPRMMAPGRYRLSIGMAPQTPPPADRAAATSAPFTVVP